MQKCHLLLLEDMFLQLIENCSYCEGVGLLTDSVTVFFIVFTATENYFLVQE